MRSARSRVVVVMASPPVTFGEPVRCGYCLLRRVTSDKVGRRGAPRPSTSESSDGGDSGSSSVASAAGGTAPSSASSPNQSGSAVCAFWVSLASPLLVAQMEIGDLDGFQQGLHNPDKVLICPL